MNDNLLDEITRVLHDMSDGKTFAKVTRVQLNRWFATESIEAMGALFDFLLEPSVCEHTEEPLQRDEVFPFFIKYWRRCLFEDPHGDWSYGRYEAGWSIQNYLLYCVANKQTHMNEAIEIVDTLADVYHRGSVDVRLCIETAILEHILEDIRFNHLFKNWQRDPVLKKAMKSSTEGFKRIRRGRISKKR